MVHNSIMPTDVGKSILLIDDEESVLFALRLLLEAIGYKVYPYNSGQAALAALSEGLTPDFILSDLRMPEIGGIEVLRQAKLILATCTRILMSAHATDEEVQSAKAIGVTSFLGKPFTVDELRQVLSSG